MSAILAFVGQSAIEKYGAYAGIAAIPGLAVLSLLYFAQAREVRRLREWAAGGPERELEAGRSAAPPATAAARAPAARPASARAAAVARPGAGPPRPATGSVRTAAAAATGAAAAARPAGAQQDGVAQAPASAPAKVEGPAEEQTGAPATTDAPADDRPAVPAAATAAAQGAADREGEAAQDAGKAEREPALAGAVPTALREREGAPGGASSPPAEVDRRGTGAASPTVGPSAAGPPRPGIARPTGARASAPVRPGTGARPGARAGAGAPPRVTGRRSDGSGRSPVRRTIVLLAVGALILLVGVVVAVTQIGGGSGDKTAPPNTIQGQPAQGGRTTKTSGKAEPVTRGDVNVAVLNGTTAPGLAQTVLDQIVASGFQDGGADTNADQQVQSTTVYYGPNQQAAAKLVAKQLKVSSVRKLDANTQAVAGADAGVVVVVGADRTP